MKRNIIIILLLIIGFETILYTVKNKSYDIQEVNNLEVKACMVDMQTDKELICD